MRVFVDQNLGGAIATLLSDADHDAVHASALGMERASDPQIFERCCAEGRTLVTADKKLTKYLASSGAKCPSVVIVRDIRTLQTRDLSGLLLANLASIESVIAEHGNAIFVIAPAKPIRATLLPLTPAADA